MVVSLQGLKFKSLGLFSDVSVEKKTNVLFRIDNRSSVVIYHSSVNSPALIPIKGCFSALKSGETP